MFIIIDYGATSIKTCIYRDDKIENYFDIDFPKNDKIEGYSVSIQKIKKTFNDILDNHILFCKSFKNLKGIYISSQMHGFYLSDGKKNITEYISWKDERGNVFFDDFGKDEFRKTTGLFPLKGIPFFNIKKFIEERNYKNDLYIKTLPNIFLDEDYNISNSSMISGLGFYDLNKKKISKELSDYFENKLIFDKITDKIEKSGISFYKDYKINIFTGIGDFQNALSALNLEKNNLIINLGTGSQIALVTDDNIDFSNEFRPFFEKNLDCITHIPSGRSIDSFLNIFENKKDLYSKISSFKKEEILSAKLKFDLNVFSGSFNFKNGGIIENINEDNWSKDDYLKGLMLSYIEQYCNLINNYYKGKFNKIYLVGGIAEKNYYIKEILEEKLSTKIEQIDKLNSMIGAINNIKKHILL